MKKWQIAFSSLITVSANNEEEAIDKWRDRMAEAEPDTVELVEEEDPED